MMVEILRKSIQNVKRRCWWCSRARPGWLTHLITIDGNTISYYFLVIVFDHTMLVWVKRKRKKLFGHFGRVAGFGFVSKIEIIIIVPNKYLLKNFNWFQMAFTLTTKILVRSQTVTLCGFRSDDSRALNSGAGCRGWWLFLFNAFYLRLVPYSSHNEMSKYVLVLRRQSEIVI